MRRICKLRETFAARPAARRIATACVVLCILLLQFLQLQLSTVQSVVFLKASPLNVLVNLALVAIPTCLLSLFFRWLTLPMALTSAIYTLWSVANVYVILYHGSPLFLNELIHARDAADVISGYSFKLTIGVAVLFIFDACEAVCLVLLRKLCPVKASFAPRRIARRALALLVCIAFPLFCLYGPSPTKPRVAMTSAYRKPVRIYGFMTILVEDIYKMFNPYTLPEGYAPEAIEAPAQAREEAVLPETPPDIVLILNESFFDLSIYTDVETDSDALAPMYGLSNATFGHAVSPLVGGGTNDSEYELLTSNSTYLLRSSAPFNYLNMEAPGNSLARYLEGFGYESWGMHCGSPKGYSRGIAYPQLGFDHILLGPDAFTYHSSYGARNWLDWDNYQDLIAQYEAAGDAPRFMYLLTYQNHGGYEQNDASMDLVHCRSDFGALTDDTDEYLTSTSMSASAFVQLTEYFAQVDRPVIVCMVGDHAPSFINELPMRAGATELNKRFVPYVIWANYDVDFPGGGAEQVSMVDFGPMLLKMGGLPLSPYYCAVLDAQAAMPVRVSTGEYVDAQGASGAFTANDPEQRPLAQYYYMEYNSLRGGSEYRAELFAAPAE